jgi:hypothetical protein
MDITTSSNIYRNNPEFYKNVLPNIKKYFYVKVTNSEINFILKLVLDNFKLKDKYELKDKFEGEAFFNNISFSYAGFKAIYYYLGKQDEVKSLKIENLIKNEIQIDNLNYKIINFQFGTLPKFENLTNDKINGIIFCLHRDKDVYFCGSLNIYNYNLTKTRYFENFKILKYPF